MESFDKLNLAYENIIFGSELNVFPLLPKKYILLMRFSMMAKKVCFAFTKFTLCTKGFTILNWARQSFKLTYIQFTELFMRVDSHPKTSNNIGRWSTVIQSNPLSLFCVQCQILVSHFRTRIER